MLKYSSRGADHYDGVSIFLLKLACVEAKTASSSSLANCGSYAETYPPYTATAVEAPTMTNRKIIATPAAPQPDAPISQAVVSNGFVFVSGITPFDLDLKLSKGDFDA